MCPVVLWSVKTSQDMKQKLALDFQCSQHLKQIQHQCKTHSEMYFLIIYHLFFVFKTYLGQGLESVCCRELLAMKLG